MSELAVENWIQGVRHGSTLDTLPAACHEAGLEPRIAFQADNLAAWQGLVAAGVGVAIIPSSIPAHAADIVIRELDAPSLARKVSSAQPAGRYTPPAAQP